MRAVLPYLQIQQLGVESDSERTKWLDALYKAQGQGRKRMQASGQEGAPTEQDKAMSRARGGSSSISNISSALRRTMNASMGRGDGPSSGSDSERLPMETSAISTPAVRRKKYPPFIRAAVSLGVTVNCFSLADPRKLVNFT